MALYFYKDNFNHYDNLKTIRIPKQLYCKFTYQTCPI